MMQNHNLKSSIVYKNLLMKLTTQRIIYSHQGMMKSLPYGHSTPSIRPSIVNETCIQREFLDIGDYSEFPHYFIQLFLIIRD